MLAQYQVRGEIVRRPRVEEGRWVGTEFIEQVGELFRSLASNSGSSAMSPECSEAGAAPKMSGGAGAISMCKLTRQLRTAPCLWRVFPGRIRERLTIIGAVDARLRELPDLCPKFFDMRDRRRLVRGVLFGHALNYPGSQRRGDDTDQTDTADHQSHGNHAPGAGDR